MLNILLAAAVVALCASFLILLMDRLGVTEKIQIKAPRLVSEAFNCAFCLSFWISVIFSLLFFIFTKDLDFLFSPILSTSLIRKLV